MYNKVEVEVEVEVGSVPVIGEYTCAIHECVEKTEFSVGFLVSVKHFSLKTEQMFVHLSLNSGGYKKS